MSVLTFQRRANRAVTADADTYRVVPEGKTTGETFAELRSAQQHGWDLLKAGVPRVYIHKRSPLKKDRRYIDVESWVLKNGTTFQRVSCRRALRGNPQGGGYIT